MYLKRIEIAGFKSFADRTILEFDTGLTAIVGPNGSGKSNITEAIRWVLGEQSAKNLRGGRMPDIIFAGSESRKQLNLAEVSVVLDNTERYLPLDFSEVSVTRRLNRNGDSDFFINKQSCRLKDIVDLFMDSGLGKESFSIISQGKVEAIFNSKPEDRRGIFEEAAGVLKYKQRKHKAEQKLFETEDNLNRVQDIVYELEDQLAPLAEQSQTAQTYLLLKEQLVQLDVGLTVQEIDELKLEWKQQLEAVERLTSSSEAVHRQITEMEKTVTTLRAERARLDQSLDEQQQKLLLVTKNCEQIEGQKQLLLERSQHAEKSSAENNTSQQTLQLKIAQLETEIVQLTTDQVTKETELTKLLKEQEKFQQELQTYSRSTKEQLEELRSRYVDIMQQQANANNDLKHLEKQYLQEKSRHTQTVKRYEEWQQKNSATIQQREQAEAALESAQAHLKETLDDYQGLQKQAAKHQSQLAILEKQMYQAMGILQQAKARQKSLQELQENHAGYYQGVRAILQAGQQLTGIIGAVAEKIHVPGEYVTAIDTALGAAAQHVLVSDEQAGRRAIAYLKEQRLGRATFLPITTIKPRILPAVLAEKLAASPGFVGIAAELVTYDEEISSVVRNLLGMTVIAKDLASANQLARLIQYKYKVVSLEGDVMNPGGSMTGGANKKGNRGSLFAQADELQSLAEKIQLMEAELKQQEQRFQANKQECAHEQEQLEEIRTAGEAARLEEQAAQSKIALLETEEKQTLREQRAFEYELQELQAFLTDYEQRKKQLEKQQTELETKRQQLDRLMETTSDEEEQNSLRKERAQTNLNQVNSQVAVIQEQLRHLQEQQLAAEQQLTETRESKQLLERQLSELTGNQQDHTTQQAALKKRLVELQQEQGALQKNLAQAKIERERVQVQIADLDQQLVASNRHQQEHLEEKNRAEIVQNRKEVGLDNLLTYLQEEYSLTYEAAKQQAGQLEDLGSARDKRQSLKQELERLGVVNIGAIEQYEQVQSRYEFLTSQRDDLLTAKNRLFTTMNEMDEEVKTRFRTVFEAIRKKFSQVFPQMFGGGHAELKLLDPADLLHTGIEIIAQPPGKQLQSLSLLSGGERALTAIALLFSIIQVRPVPFCVLDEVEAALDEANVARFGRYLSTFEKQTQFIVITHRKGTMEAADVLYGVTMEESGVSKTVSVRLEELEEKGAIA